MLQYGRLYVDIKHSVHTTRDCSTAGIICSEYIHVTLCSKELYMAFHLLLVMFPCWECFPSIHSVLPVFVYVVVDFVCILLLFL